MDVGPRLRVEVLVESAETADARAVEVRGTCVYSQRNTGCAQHTSPGDKFFLGHARAGVGHVRAGCVCSFYMLFPEDGATLVARRFASARFA